jgi:hypothetical protein
MVTRRATRWAALVAATVLVIGAGGIVLASGGHGPDGSSELVTAGLGGDGAVADPPTTTSTPEPVAATTTTTARPAISTTTTTARPVTTTAASNLLGTPPTSTTVPPVTAPPTTVPTNPASWTAEENGIALRLTMTPRSPRAGDTVDLAVEITTTMSSGTCCITSLAVGGGIVGMWTTHTGPGCPVTPTPERQDRQTFRTSYVVPRPHATSPSPTSLDIHLHAARMECSPPGGFKHADVRAPLHVSPAR